MSQPCKGIPENHMNIRNNKEYPPACSFMCIIKTDSTTPEMVTGYLQITLQKTWHKQNSIDCESKKLPHPAVT